MYATSNAPMFIQTVHGLSFPIGPIGQREDTEDRPTAKATGNRDRMPRDDDHEARRPE